MLRALSSRVVAVRVVAVGLCSVVLVLSGCGGSRGPLAAEDVKIALVAGGRNPYFESWRFVAENAHTQFVVGDVVFDDASGWDTDLQRDRIKELKSEGYNAFGIFGVDPAQTNDLFADLADDGYPVAALGSCPEGEIDRAAFCLATDAEQAAYKAATVAIDAMGGKGDLVHLTGNAGDTNTQARLDGVRRAVAATDGKVTLLTTVQDIDTDLTTARSAVDRLMTQRADAIDGVVATAYFPSVALAEELAVKRLPIKAATVDDAPAVLVSISTGVVEATVVQNPSGQALVGTYALTKLAGGCTVRQPNRVIDSGSFVVDRSNVLTYQDLRTAKSTELMHTFDTEVLACPGS